MGSRSKDRKYRQWRAQVIRKGKCCELCGSRYRRAAHHMNCWRYFPKERYDVVNGVVLCGKCHSMFHCDYKNSYRQKCTKKDYEEFTKIARRFMLIGSNA